MEVRGTSGKSGLRGSPGWFRPLWGFAPSIERAAPPHVSDKGEWGTADSPHW